MQLLLVVVMLCNAELRKEENKALGSKCVKQVDNRPLQGIGARAPPLSEASVAFFPERRDESLRNTAAKLSSCFRAKSLSLVASQAFAASHFFVTL